MMVTPNYPQKNDISPELIHFLEALPCAAYLVKNDADLTFVYGNTSFYHLFGCKTGDIRYKYGNRLGALIAPQSLKELDHWLSVQTQGKGEKYSAKQLVKKNGTEICIFTKLCTWKAQEASYLFCISCDVTENEAKMQSLCNDAAAAAFMSKEINVDTFEFDWETRLVRFLSPPVILGRVLAPVKCEYFNLEKVLLESGAIYPASVKDLTNIFACIHQSKVKMSCEIRMKTLESKALWTRLTLTVNPQEDRPKQRILGFLEDITEQKEVQLSYLNETQFYEAMLTEENSYMQVDVSDDKIMRAGGLWVRYNEVLQQKSYSAVMEQLVSKAVHPEEREHYVELMRRSNFLESLRNGIDRLGCELRCSNEQKKMTWMELSIHLFQNPFSAHTMALICMKDIDAKKRQGLAQLRSAPPPQASEEATLAPLAAQGGSVEASFADFLSAQGDIAYLVDPETLVLLCGNQAFYERMGLCRAECFGKKCYELIHRRKTPCPFCSRPNWSSDQFYLWKNYNNILEQEFLIKSKLVQWQEKKYLLVFSIDLSNNKSILNSIENGATESHCILSGVQSMAAAEGLPEVMNCALEAIGRFFSASSVSFWEHNAYGNAYIRSYFWENSPKSEPLADSELRDISTWLSTMQWKQLVVLESPEAMLCHSYGMYQLMKNRGIKNQRWLQLKNGKKELGCIGIDNISRNFQDVAFLECFTGFITDEIKKRNLMADILYAYQRDELTGLLSRNSYEKYLADYSADSVAGIGVILANVDRLKEINSGKGFHVGNDCIREFAMMLKAVFANEAVFRLNGDEFLVIAANVERAVLENKLSQLEAKVQENSMFSVSMGHSWDDVEKDLSALIEQSTQAMKINKQLHHDSIPSTGNLNRRTMLSGLVASLENKEFEVFLQPKVEFAHHGLVGAEALIRYHHKTLGYISPGYFIEKLEATNLIRYVDLFVLEEVCRLLKKWKQMDMPLPVVSVNFSRVTLIERNLLSSVKEIMERYAVNKDHIEIEVTESVAGMGKGILSQTASALRKAGFLISLDDFGTKYTNMAILSEIVFDVLKLDKSLVASLSGQQSNQIILKNMIHMCQELGIRVIAEGVETEEQEEILCAMGCTQGQGYLYGKPMPIAEFEAKYKG